MKPHIWLRGGRWHCGVPRVAGTCIVWWPRGVGDTPVMAYSCYCKVRGDWFNLSRPKTDGDLMAQGYAEAMQ